VDRSTDVIPSIFAFGGLLLLPGLAWLGVRSGDGSPGRPWPEALVLALTVGLTVDALLAVVLALLGAFGASTEAAAVLGASLVILAAGRFRLGWTVEAVPMGQAVAFLLLAALSAVLFLGRPFEMLLGGRDATVYLISGVAMSRQGSLILTDSAAEKIGRETQRLLYPSRARRQLVPQLFEAGKYEGFYYLDSEKGRLVAQGLPLMPSVIAIFHAWFGISGAFAASSVVGVLAVLSVYTAGCLLVGETAAFLGSALITLNLVEVWAARYPVAEILFQMLLFSGLAALLRGGRHGRFAAGLLLGATLLTKIEAAILLIPFAVLSVAARRRRVLTLDRAFWLPFGLLALAAIACDVMLQRDYITTSLWLFSRTHRRVFSVILSGRGFLLVPCAVAAATAMILLLWRRHRASIRPGRVAAAVVVLLVAYGYGVRPRVARVVGGDAESFVWLSWYITPLGLGLGTLGLARFVSTETRKERLFAVASLLLLSAVFLNFTFANLIHIYLTRRFVPAVLPLAFLACGYAIVEIANLRLGRFPRAAPWLAAAVWLTLVASVIWRSHHLYQHREYPALTDQLQRLAAQVHDADLVLVSDWEVRTLLGPALDLVFGVPTIVVMPKGYRTLAPAIEGWVDRDEKLVALSVNPGLADYPGASLFSPAGAVDIELRALEEEHNRFPDRFAEQTLHVYRFAAGPGSDPLYSYWKREGSRVRAVVCGSGVRIVGGTDFLVRRIRDACRTSATGAPGFLLSQGEVEAWERRLGTFGASFERRDLAGVVLLSDVRPKQAPQARPLSPEKWTLHANVGAGGESRAVDGRLDTRWGSGSPQRPGMAFTVGFPQPVDVSWVRIRMGNFKKDGAQALAVETSADGERWDRLDVPLAMGGIVWSEGVPETSFDGDLDLWVDRAGVRSIRLVNLGTHPRYDWSIAELTIEGVPAAASPAPPAP
jgi:4-amino-4-deoxy-L-arabinose transferase-like glycosyltransferase